MKKIFSFLAVALLALGFAACEDVPAPYGIEDEIIGDGSKKLPYVQSFENSLGGYKSYTLSGEGRWKIDHKAAVATGYNGSDKTTTAGSYMLISPEINLTEVDSAHIALVYALRYLKTQDDQKIMVTKSFDENNPGEGWTAIPATLEQVGTWDETRTIDVQIPAEFMGGKIRVALYFNTNDKSGSTWQVKNMSVLEGLIEGGEATPEEEVRELPYKESFSESFGGFKNYTTSGAGEWKIDFQTAKASGFDFNAQKNTAGTYYLVSPEISLANQTEVHLSYDYIWAYASRFPEGNKLFITDNFDEKNAAQNWTEIKVSHKESVKGANGKIDWKAFNKMDVQVPAEFLGKTVRVAFFHECDDKGSTTMEIKNFEIQVGKAEGGNEPEVKPEEGVQKLLYSETFMSSLGLFTNVTTDGAGEWINDFQTAKATGHKKVGVDENGKGVYEDIAGTYYLVSPEISLANQTDAHVAYEYIYRYGKGQENQQVLISSAYDEANPTANWTLLNGEHKEGTDWSTFTKADLQIPAEFMGKNIRIAFRYSCTSEGSSTWEVKNFSVAAGKVGEGGNEGGNEGGETPDAGDINALNGDFECWVGGLPNNWKSIAGNGRLHQSTDAHSGKYSVRIEGYTSNKRLAYKVIDLQPGTYNIKYYVKAATEKGGATKAGYAVVTDGVIADTMHDYVYSDFFNDLTMNEWKEINHTITIEKAGTYSMLVMNCKKPGADILVDDYTLTDASGNVLIK